MALAGALAVFYRADFHLAHAMLELSEGKLVFSRPELLQSLRLWSSLGVELQSVKERLHCPHPELGWGLFVELCPGLDLFAWGILRRSVVCDFQTVASCLAVEPFFGYIFFRGGINAKMVLSDLLLFLGSSAFFWAFNHERADTDTFEIVWHFVETKSAREYKSLSEKHHKINF